MAFAVIRRHTSRTISSSKISTRPLVININNKRLFNNSSKLSYSRVKSQRSLDREFDNNKRPEPSPSFDILPPNEKNINNNKNLLDPNLDHSLIGLTGGEIFNEMMRRNNVSHVFGYAGGAILPVYDAIYNSPNFKFILPRHEQGAGHMAEGYARASGKVGVVLVTSGPGATNVVTAMADGLADGVPMVVFSGQVPTSAIGTDAFQEADVIGISRPCTKWNVMVRSIDELPRRINEAFEIATSGRPGPVLVDLPKDVTAAILRNPVPMIHDILPYSSVSRIDSLLQKEYLEKTIQDTANLINTSKRPILYVGGGILNNEKSPQLLKQLSERSKIPVTTTLQALGSFDQTDYKSLDMLGMHGSGVANMAIQNADLIIALGARFDDRVTGNISKFAPEARKAALENRGGIIHFEICPKNINKVVETQIAVEGDVTENLEYLLPLIKTVENRDDWFTQINAWKEKYSYNYMKETPGSKIQPQTVISKLSEISNATKRKVIVTTGVGQHQMWTAQYWTWRHPRTFISSGGLGTMGYGLPAAIGAQVAYPDALVIDIDGDASFNMTLTELSSAVQAGANVKVMLLNNKEQGMVTQWQTLFYEKRYSHTHQENPDFQLLAKAMGFKPMKLTDYNKIDETLTEFVNTEGPVLLEVEVEEKTHVLPMVPAGKGLDEFMYFDAEKEKEAARIRNENIKLNHN